jgi:GTP-binding protein HflX
MGKKKLYQTTKTEKALLVMVRIGKELWPQEVLIEEFKNLVISTGIKVEDLVIAKKDRPTPSLYIGKGKAEELAKIVHQKNIDVVIFNNDLNFNQQRNLEDILGVKTIDRTQLILDIFAQHARTEEGILQVELAQLEYLLPRLKGKGIMLSRLGGGIGTRGPGEKKLEIDRRKISDRITHLKKELEEVRKHREIIRKKREKEGLGICSLVGYTNAGKSTLFNALTESQEKTSSFLFTTLDTVSRTLKLHSTFKIILTDTVGFIYKLPLNLIEAFKATLEELNFADLLLHVVDASISSCRRVIDSVNSILKELSLDSKPVILVFNKIDKISCEDLESLKNSYPQAIFVSALKRINLESLKEEIYRNLFKNMLEAIIKVPYNKADTLEFLHKNCEILKANYKKDNIVFWIKTKKANLEYLRKKGFPVEEI